MDYRTQCLGQEAELERKLQEMRTALKLAVEQLHCKADPLARLEDLDGEGIAVLGVKIGNDLITYRKTLADLVNVQRTLGR